MTSKWIQSAPEATTLRTSSPRRAKSAERRLGAMRNIDGSSLGKPRFYRLELDHVAAPQRLGAQPPGLRRDLAEDALLQPRLEVAHMDAGCHLQRIEQAAQRLRVQMAGIHRQRLLLVGKGSLDDEVIEAAQPVERGNEAVLEARIAAEHQPTRAAVD